ncbi:uncharacterized protein LOC128559783 [Mercenaria mercenaria]|uniref:uncharacterized protein LOC128559783 n=1 Tax=Mercenaria mercenaria TaxID=6596 RepID=UPI00234EC47F|nr:uncharacterized protein LOC128559783 [Mercenaria mercenaria]
MACQLSWPLNGHTQNPLPTNSYHHRASGYIKDDASPRVQPLCKVFGKKLSEIDLKELSVTSDGGIELDTEEEQTEGVPEGGPEIASVTDTDGYTPGNNNIDKPDVFTFEEEEATYHKQKKSSASNTRVQWTKEELTEVNRYFEETIAAEKTPGMKECKMAQEKSKTDGGMLHKRNWETLKKKVWNIIQKKKRR